MAPLIFTPQIGHFFLLFCLSTGFTNFQNLVIILISVVVVVVVVVFKAIFARTKFRMVLEFSLGVIFKKFAREDPCLPGVVLHVCSVGESDTPENTGVVRRLTGV